MLIPFWTSLWRFHSFPISKQQDVARSSKSKWRKWTLSGALPSDSTDSTAAMKYNEIWVYCLSFFKINQDIWGDRRVQKWMSRFLMNWAHWPGLQLLIHVDSSSCTFPYFSCFCLPLSFQKLELMMTRYHRKHHSPEQSNHSLCSSVGAPSSGVIPSRSQLWRSDWDVCRGKIHCQGNHSQVAFLGDLDVNPKYDVPVNFTWLIKLSDCL